MRIVEIRISDDAGWRMMYDRLIILDASAQVRSALMAADSVLYVWLQAAPESVLSAPEKALIAVRNWTHNGVVDANIRSLATNAYKAVALSGLDDRAPRDAGLAAAHATFALAFLIEEKVQKVFAAARDSLGAAWRVHKSIDPGHVQDFLLSWQKEVK